MQLKIRLKKIDKGLWSLMLHGLKTVGSYSGALEYMAENFTHAEYESLLGFYSWIEGDEENRSIGHGNYNERYQQYLTESSLR